MFKSELLKLMKKAMRDLMDAESWDAKKRIIELYGDLVLTDVNLEPFVGLLKMFEDNPQMIRLLEQEQDLLTRCRSEGIDAAFANQIEPPILKSSLPSAESLNRAKSMEELLDLLPEYPELLLQLPEFESIVKRLRGGDERPVLTTKLILFMLKESQIARQLYLEEYPELLTDEAMEVMEMLIKIAQEQGDQLGYALFTQRQKQLAQARQKESEFAAAPEVEVGQTRLLLVLTLCDDLEDILALVTQQRDLLSHEVLVHLKTFIAYLYMLPTEKARAERSLERHTTLSDLREMMVERDLSISEAKREINIKKRASMQILSDAIDAFINAESWQESKRIVEEKRDLLLKSIATRLFDLMLEERQDDPHAVRVLQEHRDLLTTCYYQGIEVGFADVLDSPKIPYPFLAQELGPLLSQMMTLTDPSDIPRRIELCQQALALLDREIRPELWGSLHGILGNCYNENPFGDRTLNIEQAISHYEQALQVRLDEGAPTEWAETQNNLAIAYCERSKGEVADNLEQAIYHFGQALKVYTRAEKPAQWATTQYNLANAYREHTTEERAAVNIEQAIVHYKQALEVYTPQSYPDGWARTHNNLAIAYAERIKGDKTLNLEQASYHVEQALQVKTPNGFPQDCRHTAYWLGRLLYGYQLFAKARKAFTTAHQAVLTLLDQAENESLREQLVEENAELYARLVFCCLYEGDEKAASEYAAVGKGPAFIDLLTTMRLDLSAGADHPIFAMNRQRARQLRQQIDHLLVSLKRNSH